MKWLLLAALFAGCFPYRETYRPVVDGVVVDAEGRPQRDLRVEACSATHWNHACRYRASTTTSADGRFHLDEKREWDWCCLGEAPLPYTVIAACSPDGRIAEGRVSGRSAEARMVLTTTPSEDFAKKTCRGGKF